jgi:hypothetical protein
MNYNGIQKTAQGRNMDVFSMNLAFSKDVLKDKATLSLNVSDVFNSRKRKAYTYLPGVVDSMAKCNGEKDKSHSRLPIDLMYRKTKERKNQEETTSKMMVEISQVSINKKSRNFGTFKQ